jgi:hypothetical protein
VRRARIAVAVTVGMLAVTGCSDLQGTDGKEWITGEAKVITVPEAERVAPVGPPARTSTATTSRSRTTATGSSC